MAGQRTIIFNIIKCRVPEIRLVLTQLSFLWGRYHFHQPCSAQEESGV